jgi:hypothetical protein
MRRRSRSSLRITTIVCTVVLAALGGVALALSRPTPPSPRILSGPGHSTLLRVARFRFRDSRRGVRFLCSINRSSFRACTSPMHFRRLRPGTNVFRVRARTKSGAASSPTHYRWTVLAPTPPLVISSPTANRSYDAAQWSATCPGGPGVCGTVQVPKGKLAVRITIRRVPTSRYWAGQGFSASTATWMVAKLSPAHGPAGARRRAWFYPLALPPDSLYSVSVRSSHRVPARRGRRHRWVSRALAQQAVSFTVDTAAPAVPAVPAGPVTRPSPPSPPSGQSVPFTISGQTEGPLYPGGASEILPLTVANPGDATVYVTALGVALPASSLPAGCPAGGFQITQPSLPGTGVPVPAHGSVTLSTVALGAASIQMLDTGSNQDACQSAPLALVLTGSAHS